MDDRLYRSTADRSLAGVCGGVAAWLGLDPSLVRIAWVLLTLMSGGVFLVIYIVMAVVVPDAPPGWSPRGRAQQPAPPPPGWSTGTGQGWQTGAGWQGGAPQAPQAPGGAWTPSSSGWTGTDEARRRGDRAGIVIGVVLVVLGAWFLVRDYIAINWDLVWPVAVIVLGGILIAGALRRAR